MPYTVKVPDAVRAELRSFIRAESSRRKQIQDLLEGLRTDPHHSQTVRTDLPDCFFVELDDFRLYYVCDDEKGEVRLFKFHQYWHHW